MTETDLERDTEIAFAQMTDLKHARRMVERCDAVAMLAWLCQKASTHRTDACFVGGLLINVAHGLAANAAEKTS